MNLCDIEHEMGPASVDLPVMLGARWYHTGFDVDQVEHERRSAAGLGAVVDFGTINALWALPMGGAVPLASLHPQHQQLLAAQPSSVANFQGEIVSRLTSVPVNVRYLIAERKSASSALDALADRWWAPLEVAVIPGSASARAAGRAARGRIGLVDATGWRVRPVAKSIGRPTPLLWWQAELVYAAWLRSSVQPTAEAGARP